MTPPDTWRTARLGLAALILAALCVLAARGGLQAAGPLCEETVGAQDTCKNPVAFAARLESPYTFEFDTGFKPGNVPIKGKVFYYSSPGELGVKATGNIVATWEAAKAFPGNSFPVTFEAEGIDSLSPWESDGGLRFGARYKYNVEMGWTRFKKEDYIPGIPHMDVSWPCKTTVQPFGLYDPWPICVTYWGDVGVLACWLRMYDPAWDFPSACGNEDNFTPSVSFGSCHDGNYGKPPADSAKFVVTTRPAIPVKISLGAGMGACVALSLDGHSIVDSTTGESITQYTPSFEDSLEIPCSFAKATEDERVFYFTQGPFHYNADLAVSVVAKVEPHVIACIAQMLKVTFQLGAAICPMVIPSPLYSQLNYPIPFSEMDATFAVPVSDPEVCNIEPDSGVVELGDSVDVTWNTSWGAPDPCDCRADIWFRTRVDQMSSWLPWEPIVPVHDTLNTGSVKWYVDAPLWHQAQIRVRFKDPDDSVLAIDTGGIFTIGFGASVETPEDLPKEFALLPAYPNPFIGGVTIEFTVPTIRNVRVRIYDARGRLVRDLLDGPVAPGHRVIIWDGDTNAGKDAGPGVYFVAVESPEKRLTQKIELLK